MFHPGLKNVLTRITRKCQSNDKNSFDPCQEERHFTKSVEETHRDIITYGTGTACPFLNETFL